MRDFFYNKGDVLIAILIIAVAIVVIYFRVGVVMGDPDPGERIKNLFASLPFSGQTGENAIDETDDGEAAQGGDAVAGSESADAVEPPVSTDTTDTTTDQAQQPESPPVQESPPPEQPPEGATDVTITVVSGDSASTIADKLLAALIAPRAEHFPAAGCGHSRPKTDFLFSLAFIWSVCR